MGNETVIERNVNQDAVTSLKNLILAKMETLESLDEQIKEANDVISGALLDNPAYHRADDTAKEAAKERGQVRAQIMDTTEMKNFAGKRKELKAQKDEAKGMLSDYLLDYERLSGASLIAGRSGEQLTIFKTATVAKAK